MSDKTDPTNVVVHLAKRFGSQLRLAEAAGCKQNTISDRKAANSLRHDQMRRILERAPAMGVEIDPWDFFPELRAARQDAAA